MNVKSSFAANVIVRGLFLTAFLIFAVNRATAQATTQNTANKADQVLRSNGRVNPSTLGMEMDIPLTGYPGRGISLPVSLSYSSKLWRLQQFKKRGLGGESPCNAYTFPVYAEDSASGWTTSLARPEIEYTGQNDLYDNHGNPIPRNVICGEDNSDSNLGSYVKRIHIKLPSGGSHELRAADAPIYWERSGNCTPATQPYCDSAPGIDSNWYGTYYAVDGSGYKYVESATGSRLWLPDGSFYDFGAREIRSLPGVYTKKVRRAVGFSDRNGNTIAYHNDLSQFPNGYWTDTLGRIISIPLTIEEPAEAVTQTYNLPGLSTSYKFYWQKLADARSNPSDPLRYSGDRRSTGSGLEGVSPYLFQSDSGNDGYIHILTSVGGAELFNPVVLAKIELPNGQFYQFGYNVFGEIDRIQYPRGGEEKFTYNQIEPMSDTEGPYKQTNRGVTQRSVFAEAGQSTPTATWSYGTNPVTASYYMVYTIAPDGTRGEQFLTQSPQPPQLSGSWGYDSILAGMAYEERQFSSTGTLLSRKLTTRQKSVLLNLSTYEEVQAQWHPRVVSEESIVYDNSGSGLSTKTTIEYDGDLSQPDAPLNVKRTTAYAFAVVAGGNSIVPNGAPAASPTQGMTLTATGISETDYLNASTDFNLASLKTACANQNMLSLPIASRMKNGANTVQSQSRITYDEANYSIFGRCNATGAAVWDSTKGAETNQAAYLTTKMKFDVYGNVVETTDGRGNVSTVEYSPAYNYAYPTKTTTPVPDPSGIRGSSAAFQTTINYDFNTGLPLSTTDANGQTTTVEYNDLLLRPTKATAPNGQQTITEYGAGNTAATRFVKVKTQIDEQKWKEAYSWFDGLGRAVKSQSVDSSGDVFALTCYDQYGRLSKVSNPFRNISNPSCSSTNLEWTTTTYDSANRVWKITTPDNAVVETNYSLATSGNNLGTVVTVKDQALKERRSITNALGQIVRVDEPFENKDSNGNVISVTLGTIAAPAQPTYYEFDALNNLTKVKQGGTETNPTQTRSFVYDSLSRLKSANNPESGIINFAYDNNGNLIQKTDARTIQTNYSYDALNRVTQRSYANEPTGQTATPTVNYVYDNLPNAKGRLIKVSSSVSTFDYKEYDLMGRLTKSQQTTDGITFNEILYKYNLSSGMVEQTYPSGRVVRYLTDSNGSISKVQSRKNQDAGFFTYAAHFSYTAAGGIRSMQLGNGRWESAQFNSRLQPTQIALGTTQDATDLLKLNYDYGTTDNNGNIKSQTITVPTAGQNQGFTATQIYQYDSLNRLKSATENISGNQTWKQTFVYDRYGNRRFDNANNNTTTLAANCPTAVCNPQVDPATNKLVGYSFDGSGNTTVDADNRQFIYNGDNQQTEVKDAGGNPVGKYFYDGDGRRVKKIAYNQYGQAQETTIFVYDASGKMLAEYSTQVSQTPQVSYLTVDPLGSPRVITDRDGKVTSRRDFMPFGEEIASAQRTQGLGYKADDVRKKFATYERDTETSLDYAQARYFNSGFGRFSTPDYFTNDTNVTDPQSWNLYSYARNNPIKFSDPLGTQVLVMYKDENGDRHYLEYRDGKLYNTTNIGGRFEAGDQYTGSNATALKILKDLNTLTGNEELKDRLAELVKASTEHIVGSGSTAGSSARDSCNWAARKPSDTETTYNTEKDEDGGSNTQIPLARALLGEAYNMAKGNTTSRGTGRNLNNDDGLFDPETDINENGAGTENTAARIDSLKMENLARSQAGVPLVPVPPSEGRGGNGFVEQPSSSGSKLAPPPPLPVPGQKPPPPPQPKPINPCTRKPIF